MSGPTWSKVPREAFEDDRLTKTQLRVLGILASHADAKGICTRRQEAVAEEIHLTRESVCRAISRLVALGYVVAERRAGMKRSLRYRVLIAEGARGQLPLFGQAETPRAARAEARNSRCDADITTDVTLGITSVVSLGVTSVNEQPLINRDAAADAGERVDDFGEQAEKTGPLEDPDTAPFQLAADENANPAGETGPAGGQRDDHVEQNDLDGLEAKLREAAGAAINAAHPGFLSLADPLGWLAAGCDLDMDILPAIRRVAARKRDGPIFAGWRYFERAVLEDRDRRLAIAARSRPSEPPGRGADGTSTNVVPFGTRRNAETASFGARHGRESADERRDRFDAAWERRLGNLD